MRRAAGTGTVYKYRSDLWVGELNLRGPDKTTQRFRTGYCRSRADAEAELETLKFKKKTGTLVAPSKLLTQKLVEEWLEDGQVSLGWSGKTLDQYKYLAGYLIERLGTVPVQGLSPHHVRLFLSSMQRDHKTLDLQEKCLKRLRQVLDMALGEGLVAQNAVDIFRRERKRRGRLITHRKAAPKLLTGEQVIAFIAAVQGAPLGALFILALSTGARFGELLALQKDDVDLKCGLLRINSTLEELPRQPLNRKKPKTESSVREIPLLPIACEVIKSHLARQKDRLAKQKRISPWIFANADGGPLRQSNVRHRHFKPLLAKAGLPNVTFHSLRKSFISMLAREGVHVSVARALAGHKDSRMTLDVYTHVEPGLLGENIARLDKYFVRRGSS